MGLIEKIFGNYSQKELKRIDPLVKKVLALEDTYRNMSEEELRSQTAVLKERLANGETLDDILPEAFAACREACDRVLDMRPYPVQVIGGIILHQGRIAEMKTGEGKTLVETLPAYLNALSGKGVHIVTVNDYLAKRDSEWMGKVFSYMGLSVGLVIHGVENDDRREAYASDITYGTNNEFGFDYLRDNMVTYKENRVQRGFNYAIVDEVDSILIDEARTPLIISGRGDKSTDLYQKADRFVRTLTAIKVKEHDDKEETDDVNADYIIDEKANTATLTPRGAEKAEKYFNVENINDADNMTLLHHINQAIKAHGVMKRDVDYVVKDGEVIIVDEFTGRLMLGRRYNDGLHQAIEAKEGVTVARENRTLATITFQNYFRMYHKLAGMTGTAETEAGEFWEIYKLDVVTIPTNKPVLRNDMPDRVYKTQKEKFNAVIAEIEKMRNSGRPTLVGTTSVEISEMLSRMLRLRHIPHQVLNAKLHQQEADIVAQAGQSVDGKGVVTIATNMAGRGTDIKLSKEVKDAGGLAIIGTERHESRRVDRQLRGRAGRQGDPGSSVFFVSFEDKVMRLFASEKIVKLLDRLGLEDGEAIESPMVTKSIENAQKRVEENNFGIRKHTLEYDDVMNAQRKVIYTNRHHAVLGERIGLDIINTIYDTVEDAVGKFNDYEYEDFKMHVLTTFAIEPPFDEDEYRKLDKQDKIDRLYKVVNDAFNRKMERLREVATPVINQIAQQQLESGAPEVGGQIRVPIGDGKRMFGIVVNIKEAYETGCKNLVKAWQKAVLLLSIDENWKEHLRELDQLRQSVQNASYEQKDPLVIYKVESFKLFQTMLGVLNTKVVATLLRGQIPVEASDPDSVRREGERAPERTRPQQRLSENRGDDALAAAAKANAQAAQSASPQSRQPQAPLHVGPKVMPNDPCPCGSGKKYKKCHGRFA